MTSSELRLLPADILYTGMGLPLMNGAVVVSGDTIAATGAARELRAAYPHAREETSVHVIAPQPVNAHTHLDMTHYSFRQAPFHEWLADIVTIMFRDPHLRGLNAMREGLEQIRQAGTRVIGDIVAREEGIPFLLAQEGLTGVAYWEVIGPDPTRASDILRSTLERVRLWRKMERRDGVRLGLSPHAPYTVSSRLMRELVTLAQSEGLPLQIHLAESPAELELLRYGTGGLSAGFERNNLRPTDTLGRTPSPDLTPVQYLADLGVLDAKPTLVHVVNATEEDARIIAASGALVVTCPRSNRNLSCGTFNWPLFARLGVEIALGTDSVASGETLDVHDEIRAARELYPQLDERALIRAAVKGGSRVVNQKVPFLRRGEPWRPEYVWPEQHVQSATT